MKTASKPADKDAEGIRFGVEIETFVPSRAGLNIGPHWGGLPVHIATLPNGTRLAAPTFNGAAWRAERDGSILFEDLGAVCCEFISPILQGEAGIQCLIDFVRFANAIGAKVNDSCGLHVTVSIPSVIGTSEIDEIAEFVRKLVHFCKQNAWAIYAQTGAGRHVNRFAHQLGANVGENVAKLANGHMTKEAADCLAIGCGRGMVNLQKAFRGENSVIEFRAFASTLNIGKVLHHVATALGLMRRAAVAKVVGRFEKSTKKNRATTAVAALRRLWRILGWCDATESQLVALGLFGALHTEFGAHRKVALTMAHKFDDQYPHANL